jgi:hypothetical protein
MDKVYGIKNLKIDQTTILGEEVKRYEDNEGEVMDEKRFEELMMLHQRLQQRLRIGRVPRWIGND